MKYNLLDYTIKVWATIVFIAPLILGIFFGVKSGRVAEGTTTAFLSLITGTILSFPGAVLFRYISPLTTKNRTNVLLIKIELAFMALAIILLSVYIVTDFYGTMVPLVTCVYCIMTALSIFIYKLEIIE